MIFKYKKTEFIAHNFAVHFPLNKEKFKKLVLRAVSLCPSNDDKQNSLEVVELTNKKTKLWGPM